MAKPVRRPPFELADRFVIFSGPTVIPERWFSDKLAIHVWSNSTAHSCDMTSTRFQYGKADGFNRGLWGMH
jgi:hypothetical protein